MDDEEKYRREAEEMERRAREAVSPDERAAWERLARSWRALIAARKLGRGPR